MSIKDNFPSVGPSLSLNFARSKTLDPRITFARPSTSGDATYTDGNGLIVTAAADEPRFDHKYENGVVKSLGLLVEEQRTNLITYSEDLTATNWNLGNGGTGSTPVITANYGIAPDGTQTANRVQLNKGAGTTTSDHSTVTNNSYSTVVSQPYAQSIWLKTTDGSTKSVRFSFNGVSASILTVTGTWQRFSVQLSSASDTVRHFRLNLKGTFGTSDSADLLVWGAQVENGSFETSYIPTSGSTKTRVNDILSIQGTNFTDVYNQTEGFYKVEGFIDGTLPSNTYGGIFGAGGGSSTSNFIFLNPSNSFGQYVCNTSQTPNSTLGKTYTNGAKFKIAASYLEADFACSFNGDISNSSTSGALYGSMTYFRIGGNPISGLTGGIKGAMRISNISYYPKQITDTQLQNLTK